MGGYTLAFSYFMHRSDQQIVKQIYDNKINSAKLIEIKVPVNLPYITDWKEYEQVQGQIQLNGTYYNYVRLKMTHDTMSLICIPNTVKTNLAKANVIMANEMNDVPLSKKGHDNSSSLKKSGLENEFSTSVYRYVFTIMKDPLKSEFHPLSTLLTHPYIDSPGKPPNSIA
jgi:hypothetical protein